MVYTSEKTEMWRDIPLYDMAGCGWHCIQPVSVALCCTWLLNPVLHSVTDGLNTSLYWNILPLDSRSGLTNYSVLRKKTKSRWRRYKLRKNVWALLRTLSMFHSESMHFPIFGIRWQLQIIFETGIMETCWWLDCQAGLIWCVCVILSTWPSDVYHST